MSRRPLQTSSSHHMSSRTTACGDRSEGKKESQRALQSKARAKASQTVREGRTKSSNGVGVRVNRKVIGGSSSNRKGKGKSAITCWTCGRQGRTSNLCSWKGPHQLDATDSEQPPESKRIAVARSSVRVMSKGVPSKGDLKHQSVTDTKLKIHGFKTCKRHWLKVNFTICDVSCPTIGNSTMEENQCYAVVKPPPAAGVQPAFSS
eukprot:3267312-Amphidinium_carterae.9